jgi:DNA invertase Pin-like site-specific DNA recombinase
MCFSHQDLSKTVWDFTYLCWNLTVFGALAQFERRLIAERTRDGVNAARAKKGSRPGRPPLNPEKLEAALLLVKGGMSPTKAARRTALGRSTLYREIQARDHA